MYQGKASLSYQSPFPSLTNWLTSCTLRVSRHPWPYCMIRIYRSIRDLVWVSMYICMCLFFLWYKSYLYKGQFYVLENKLCWYCWKIISLVGFLVGWTVIISCQRQGSYTSMFLSVPPALRDHFICLYLSGRKVWSVRSSNGRDGYARWEREKKNDI